MREKEPRIERDPYEITEMPDKETLQDFLRGGSNPPTVIFRIDTGIFERTRKDEKA